MLQDAHQLKDQGIDVVIAFVETPVMAASRQVNRSKISRSFRNDDEYRGNAFEEMDLEAIFVTGTPASRLSTNLPIQILKVQRTPNATTTFWIC